MDLEKILPKDGPPINEVTKYIEKYKNDLIVIKYGGNVLIDRNVFNNFITDLSVLNKLGLATVVIHGGGPRIKRELEKSNIQSKFIRGLRVSDTNIIKSHLLENAAHIRLMFMGMILLITLRFAPKGLIPEVKR